MSKAIVLTRNNIKHFNKIFNGYDTLITTFGHDLHPTFPVPTSPDSRNLVISGDKNTIYYHVPRILQRNKYISSVWLIGHPCEFSIMNYLKKSNYQVNLIEHHYYHYFNRWYGETDKNIKPISWGDLSVFLQGNDIKGFDKNDKLVTLKYDYLNRGSEDYNIPFIQKK